MKASDKPQICGLIWALYDTFSPRINCESLGAIDRCHFTCSAWSRFILQLVSRLCFRSECVSYTTHHQRPKSVRHPKSVCWELRLRALGAPLYVHIVLQAEWRGWFQAVREYSTFMLQINNPGNLGYVPNSSIIVNLSWSWALEFFVCALGTSLNNEQFHLPQHLMFSLAHIPCVSDLWRTVPCLVHP